jgi:hypothetical protein
MEFGTATGVHNLECIEGSADGTYVIIEQLSDTVFKIPPARSNTRSVSLRQIIFGTIAIEDKGIN